MYSLQLLETCTPYCTFSFKTCKENLTFGLDAMISLMKEGLFGFTTIVQ